jgi:NTE family protein
MPEEAIARLPSLFAKAQSSPGDAAAARAEVGAYALSAPVEDEEPFVARVTASLPANRWPERWFGCVAVDVEDGRVKVLSRDCCAELGRAVAASCSLPGLSPPVRIGQRRYMDGGMRSTANADLADRCDIVFVISFQLPGPAGGRIAARLAQQVDKLHDAGADVLVITPDATSLASIGSNSMDVTRRPQVAQSAIAQGQAQAEMAAAFWNQRSE